MVDGGLITLGERCSRHSLQTGEEIGAQWPGPVKLEKLHKKTKYSLRLAEPTNVLVWWSVGRDQACFQD